MLPVISTLQLFRKKMLSDWSGVLKRIPRVPDYPHEIERQEFRNSGPGSACTCAEDELLEFWKIDRLAKVPLLPASYAWKPSTGFVVTGYHVNRELGQPEQPRPLL